MILITHDLGVMSTIADRLTVFYAGRVVESGATRDVLQDVRGTRTRAALLDALPHPEAVERRALVADPRHARRPRRTARPAARSTRAARYAIDELPRRRCRRSRRSAAAARLACPVDPFARA